MISRTEVVECARSWIGTPYHYGGQVKGAGADCATLIYCVYRSCGLVPEEEIGIFAGDWWLHTKDEKYMLRIVRHAYKVVEANCYRSTKAEPGNIVMLKAGSRIFNHGAVVTAWPHVVHAIHPHVEEIDASRNPMWANQQIAVFDPWLKAESRSSLDKAA